MRRSSSSSSPSWGGGSSDLGNKPTLDLQKDPVPSNAVGVDNKPSGKPTTGQAVGAGVFAGLALFCMPTYDQQLKACVDDCVGKKGMAKDSQCGKNCDGDASCCRSTCERSIGEGACQSSPISRKTREAGEIVSETGQDFLGPILGPFKDVIYIIIVIAVIYFLVFGFK